VAERLQKYLATAGVASRRACETLIESGRIKVNGIVVKTLGTSVEPGEDVVDFDGRRIEPERLQVYLMVNKPIGYISAASDPEGRPVVTSLVPPEYGRVYPVGRLDWDTEGAVILTNDGELTQLLTHPRHEVAKIYQAKLRGIVDNMDPRIERLRQGVMLDDGYVTLPADVIRDSDTGNHTWFVVGIREGKNRQIRRMFEAVHLDLIKLRRVAYATVQLGAVPLGDHRRLLDSEVEALYRAAGSERDLLKASRGRVPTRQRDSRVNAIKEAGKAIKEEQIIAAKAEARMGDRRTARTGSIVGGGEGRGTRTARPERSDRPARPGDRAARPEPLIVGSEGRTARPARPEVFERPERPARPERSDRPARPERSDRPARPERSDRPARPGDRPARPERSDRPARPGDRPARPERADRPARPGDRPARPERSDRPARPGDRPARPERSDRPARPERADRPARPERSDRPASPGDRPARPERSDRPARPERSERPARPATPRAARPTAPARKRTR
jgi:23S rRNA pseudouridine2605 synthase